MALMQTSSPRGVVSAGDDTGSYIGEDSRDQVFRGLYAREGRCRRPNAAAAIPGREPGRSAYERLLLVACHDLERLSPEFLEIAFALRALIELHPMRCDAKCSADIKRALAGRSLNSSWGAIERLYGQIGVSADGYPRSTWGD